LYEDWFWAGIIIAVPVALFALFEAVVLLRRRRHKALARRSKELQAKAALAARTERSRRPRRLTRG
jgi:hypothetical protein